METYNNLSSSYPRSRHQAVRRGTASKRRTPRQVTAVAARSSSPYLLVVAQDAQRGHTLAQALRRRFGEDYLVVVSIGHLAAKSQLQELATAERELALVLAEADLADVNDIELLAHARLLHRGVRRGLVTSVGDLETDERVNRAMVLGQVDFRIRTPWASPEEHLYPLISEALATWYSTHRERFGQVKVIGHQWAARSHELRDFAIRNRIPFDFRSIETPEGARILSNLSEQDRQLPVVMLPDNRILENPSNAELAEALGAATRPDPGIYDVAVVGAGPAGLASAVYAASEGLRVVVIESEAPGGQAGTTSMIRNYLGFPRGVSGEELAGRAYEQAVTFGVHFVYARSATGLSAEGPYRILTLSDGTEVTSRTVVLAGGVSYRRLDIPSVDRLIGAGVFYGAAISEAQAVRGAKVYVVGGGNSAGQAALHLSEYAAEVTILVRGESLASSMSTYLINQIAATSNISVRYHSSVIEALGRHRLEGLVLKDAERNVVEEVAADAAFIMIGAVPRTEWLKGVVQRDQRGYVLSCRDLQPNYEESLKLWPIEHRLPFSFESCLPGVFTAGDVRHNSVKRVAAAVGEGSALIMATHAYIDDISQTKDAHGM